MLVLQRIEDSLGSTVGTFWHDSFRICSTIELPWKDNHKDISCIPAGEYEIDRTFSPTFKKFTYEILNVPNRIGIRIHSANSSAELRGCIATVHHVFKKDTFWVGITALQALKDFEDYVMSKHLTRLLIKDPPKE